MERKQMEVDFLIKGLEQFIDNDEEGVVENVENVENIENNDKKVELSQSKHSVPISRKKIKNDNHELSRLLEMNKDNVLRGIIFSEILGSPRARRRR